MIKKIIFFVGIGLGLFIFSLPASAVDLTVSCDSGGCSSTGTKPLFSEGNIYPGWTVTKEIKAENNYGEDREFALEIVNFTDPDSLGEKIEVEVKETAGASLFSGTLTDLENEGYLILSSVITGDDKDYQLSAELPTSVGNLYQSKNLSFDFNFGFESLADGDIDGDTTTTTDGGLGGAGDGGCDADKPGVPLGLTAVSGGVGQVNLSWTPPDTGTVTHYAIVYGTTSGVYLYGNYNVGNVTSYTVSGLTPGGTYYFLVRAVNDCAPGPYSSEEVGVAGFVEGAGVGPVVEGPAEGFEEVQGEATEGEVGGEGEFEEGQEAGVMTARNCFWWLLTIVALIINSIFVYRRRDDFDENKKLWLVPVLISLLGFLGDKLAHRWWEPSIYCSWTWLATILSLLLPFLALHIFKKRV